jgi:hypothetical protein
MQHTVRTAKVFAEKFNSRLDDLAMPNEFRTRIQLVAKLLRISPEKVRYWLNGSQLPNDRELNLIINELGLDAHWLKNDDQSSTHH